MSDIPIEYKLGIWATSLRDIKDRVRPLFKQKRVADAAMAFLDDLLTENIMRFNSERALYPGQFSHKSQQTVLGRTQWDADQLCSILRHYALETLAHDDAVLVIGELPFLKQGGASCGVGKQHAGLLRRVANCQIGVFASYASEHGQSFIDRSLYLPKKWIKDDLRRASTSIPPELSYESKQDIAISMIERTCLERIPYSWVSVDESIAMQGTSQIRAEAKHAHIGYVIPCNPSHVGKQTHTQKTGGQSISETISSLSRNDWRRAETDTAQADADASAWAYLTTQKQRGGPDTPVEDDEWEEGILVQRPDAGDKLTFYLVGCPGEASVEQLISVAGKNRLMSREAEWMKDRLGLDRYETRSWHGWHRHVTFVMLAHAICATVDCQVNSPIVPGEIRQALADFAAI